MGEVNGSSVEREDADDIPFVLGEISTVMRARGAALTLHPGDGERPRVVYADAKAGLRHDLVDRLLVERIDWQHADQPNAHRWISCELDEPCRDAMLIPVQTVPGHSRLLISVFFDNLTAERRAEAEEIYARRAPFAIGYFRLWQLNRSRSREVTALRTALDLTEMAILLVDRTSKLKFGNRAAHEMLTAEGGLRLHKNGLRATHLRDSVRLQMAIEHVIAANSEGTGAGEQNRRAPLLSLERENAPPLIVSVLPVETRASEPSDVAAIIYALDPARDVESTLKPVCQIYRLSPVETRLTCILSTGASLAEAAKKMRVKEMTARSYLKQIFIKTNTHRQGELMQLMLSSVIRTSPTIIAEPLQTI